MIKFDKRIHFVVLNNWATYIVHGWQTSEQMRKLGIQTSVLNIKEDIEVIKELKHSIVVFIKDGLIDSIELMNLLKRQGNKLVWILGDGFRELFSKEVCMSFDAALVPNNLCIKDWSSSFSDNCFCEVLYTHWDPRCLFNTASDFSLAYVGIVLEHNLSYALMKSLQDLTIVNIDSDDQEKNKEIFKKILPYNCHLSIRTEDEYYSKYKPNVKLSFASGTNSNIILTRDQSFVELLDTSYPYYTSSAIEDVQKTVQYAKETYNTKVWFQALDMMKDVRERTSVERICNDIINIFRQF